MGVAAVDALLENQRDIMIASVQRQMVSVPFSEALKDTNKLEKELIRVADILSV
jgi:6-phosphofructokinase 1